MREQQHEPIKVCDAINQALDLAEDGYASIIGTPSGFPPLDLITRGWMPGDLVVIGARPAIGKTALGLGMAKNAAVSSGIPTGYITADESTSVMELVNRLIIAETGMTRDRLNGLMDSEDWHNAEVSLTALSKAPLYFDDCAGMPLGELKERVSGLIVNQGVKLLIIDAIQWLIPDDDRTEMSQADLNAELLRFLKQTAVENGLSVILFSWIGRSNRRHYHGPVVSDLLFYCPCAEDFADKILLLDRPEIFNPDYCESAYHAFSIFLARNKNGITGKTYLDFDRIRARICNPADILCEF